MGERTRRWGLAVAMALFVAVGAGCSDNSDDSNPPSTWATPASVDPCDSVTVYPSYNASGYVAAFHWDDDVHAYGESVSITACFSGAWIATPEGPPGVTFEPSQQEAPETEYHVISFNVNVPEGAAGPILVQLGNSDGGIFATPPGPVITPSGDGWRFTFPTDP